MNAFLQQTDDCQTHLFYPGSEWQYVKIYCSPSWIDRILTSDLLTAVAADLPQESNRAKLCFFVRYWDPEPHLRLRFLSSNISDVVNPLRILCQGQLGLGVARIALDTYVRETNRYGGSECISAAEDFFCADSMFVCTVLKSRSSPLQECLEFCVAAAHQIFECLCIPLSERIALLNEVTSYMFREFAVSDSQERNLGARYRRDRTKIENAVKDELPSCVSNHHAINASFTRRQKSLTHLSTTLSKRSPVIHRLGSDVNQVATSLLHMYCNRFFPVNQRLNEMVLVDTMRRAYAMKQATTSMSLKPRLLE